MFCKVHRPVNTPCVSDNKHSCAQLVKYLTKESELNKPYYDNFFSHTENFVNSSTVINAIDSNHKTLKAGEDKFYMLSINPSDRELKMIVKKQTGKDNVSDFDSLSVDEQEKVIQELKEFARSCMDEYAKNFYRDKVVSGNDLVYYGRVETERLYKNTDQEVKDNRVKVGDKKSGLNLHIHIIVSRMDKSQTVRLSPLTRESVRKSTVNGRNCVVGFNRSEWANRCFEVFSQNYYMYSLNQTDKDFLAWYNNYHRLNNKLFRQIQHAALKNEFKNEEKAIHYLLTSYRFFVNPKAEIKKQLRKLALSVLNHSLDN